MASGVGATLSLANETLAASAPAAPGTPTAVAVEASAGKSEGIVTLVWSVPADRSDLNGAPILGYQIWMDKKQCRLLCHCSSDDALAAKRLYGSRA